MEVGHRVNVPHLPFVMYFGQTMLEVVGVWDIMAWPYNDGTAMGQAHRCAKCDFHHIV